ncbi:MAG: branched-chain amino acid aminotransferase [Parasphingorhabdus sp.]|jgi:branched-chain amino acid aminotransferase
MTNIDGVIRPTAQACVPVMDRGFLYGDSVYEVFRTYSGVALYLGEHFDRLENSARLIRMQISQGRDDLKAEICRTIEATGARQQDVFVRYQITRGVGEVDLYADPSLQTSYVIIVKALPDWKESYYSQGLHMAVPKIRRNPINALDPNIKGGNYLNNVLAVTEAREKGADDCIMLNREGFVSEASNSNVWFVIHGELVTPASGNLQGLTRQALHQALRNEGVKSRDAEVHVNELYDASECFVTSATRAVMPVKQLVLETGHRFEFPEGGGEFTRKSMQAYREHIESYVSKHQEDAMFEYCG